jgi:hypothetical protein
MSGFIFWVLVCVLFLMAVACAAFGVLVRSGERPYLYWAAFGGWAMLCVALGWVMWAGFS